MKKVWASQIEAWNARVRAGEGNNVARELAGTPRQEIPLDQLAKVANLAWRLNRPEIGLRLLYSELRRHQQLDTKSHPDLYSEYAGCLLEVGALPEAKSILSEVHHTIPRAKFYQALLLFKEWNYAEACPLLEDYLQEIPRDYHHLVVRVNLLASYVQTQDFAKAISALQTLKSELQSLGHSLLLGNCCEIESQIYFQQGDYQRALQCLAECETHLDKTQNMGWLYCKKWQLINRLYLGRLGQENLDAELENLKSTARKMNSIETLRELDFHWAIQGAEENLLNHVFYGTPSPCYRERIINRLAVSGCRAQIAQQYIHGSGQHTVNLKDFVIDGGAKNYLLKKLFVILASDFYGSFRVGQLFSTLFTGEFYNLDASQDRVFQVVRQLRRWLASEFPGCAVISDKRGYSLSFSPGYGTITPLAMLDETIDDKSNVHYLFLREKFGGEHFSSSQMGKILRCSTRSANRMLKLLKSRGQVISMGNGPRTRFKLVS